MKALGAREPSRFASLSSGLLARKGHASPAMRRQGADAFHAGDDLGWNDMGAAGVPASPAIVPVPEVVRQQAALEATIALPVALPVVQPAEAERQPEPEAAMASVIASQPVRTGKAAFTLRLDPDRHLRLRLACAVRRQSAQAIVSRALDMFLDTLPEIDALAGQVGPAAPSR